MLAAVALLAMVLHAGLIAQHALMPLGFDAVKLATRASSTISDQQSAAFKWAAALGVPICHGTTAPDGNGQPGGPAPGKAVQHCLVCGSILAAISDATALIAHVAPSHAGTAIASLSGTPSLHFTVIAGFDARGPPRQG